MRYPISYLLFLFFLTNNLPAYCQATNPMIWRLDSSLNFGTVMPIIIGDPKPDNDDGITSIYFNGESDGIILPVNPVQKLKGFTVEVLFKPSSEGNPEQRFVHFQDKNGNRGLIEIRLQDGQWWLDTYLHVGRTDKGLTLVDRTRRHPCDKWYWAALVYDGNIMRHYLNADEGLSGKINFGPMESGIISIGVRLNQVFWFKGNISEIRVHSKPVNKENLQKIDL